MFMVLASSMMFEGCSEDEGDYDRIRASIIGIWCETEISNGMTSKITYIFNSNGTASQRYMLKLSFEGLFDDYVIKDVINNYTYTYNKNSTITFKAQNNSSWTYDISINGNNMRLGNQEDGYFNLVRAN